MDRIPVTDVPGRWSVEELRMGPAPQDYSPHAKAFGNKQLGGGGGANTYYDVSFTQDFPSNGGDRLPPLASQSAQANMPFASNII